MSTHDDHVDGILAQWARERPDLDASPMGLIGRLHRLAQVLDERLRPIFAEAGLGRGDFDVLATLRRSGAPYELSPTELAASSMVTSSAVTKRVDRLERDGLVTREQNRDDARARRIRLTERGFDLVDRLVEQHLVNEHALVSHLSDLERTRLAHLLKAWTLALDE